MYHGSAIMIDNSILIVPGLQTWDSSPMERLDFEGDRLVNQEVLGEIADEAGPVLMQVPFDHCV